MTDKSSKSAPRKWLKELSSLANVVVGQCARILVTSIEDLQIQHQKAFAVSIGDSKAYARSFLEYCCLRALAVATRTPGYLCDNHFRRMTFDMMLAWETPDSAGRCIEKDHKSNAEGSEVDKDPALFYSSLMPLLVEMKSTVSQEAFIHLGPAIGGVADIINARRQYDALARPFGGRLTFRIYDKYLMELDKAIERIKNQSYSFRNLRPKRRDESIVLDMTARCKPVIQHVGVSTLSGQLILTNQELYFKSSGMVPHENWYRWDLATDRQQVVRPWSSGPWGLPLFDRGISYYAQDSVEQVVFEFPELFDVSSRDYWLTIIQEVSYAHQFIRKFQLGGASSEEVLSRCVLGIARLWATKEAIRAFHSNADLLLCFSVLKWEPSEHLMLRLLGKKLKDGVLKHQSPRKGPIYAKSATAILCNFGFFNSMKKEKPDDEMLVGEICFDEFPIFQKVATHLCNEQKKLLHSQITVAGEKADNLSINLAIMKVLLVTLNPIMSSIKALQSWEDPAKTIAVILLGSLIIIRDFLPYVPPLLLLGVAAFIIFFKQAGEGPLSGEITVVSSSALNTIDQLVELQQLLFWIEGWLKTGSTVLLKIRALLYSILPRVTDQVILALIAFAVVLTVLPGKVIMLFFFWEALTRQMPLRKDVTECYRTKLKKWWLDVPVAPVNFR